MPLSDQEKRALEELEAQLAADDPRFASAMVSDPHQARRRRRILLGGLGCIVGVVLLVLAVVLRQPLVGVLGFVAITLGVAHAMTDSKPTLRSVPTHPSGERAPRAPRAPRRGKTTKNAGQHDFMRTLENRWERRRRENHGW